MSSFQKTYSKIDNNNNNNSSSKKTPWRNNNERHYCPICNVWMASDIQSIRLHENGQKHKTNVELDLQKRREEKTRKEKEERMVKASLERMERVANEKFAGDVQHGGFGATVLPPSSSSSSSLPSTTALSAQDNKSKREIASSWQERKRLREEEKKKLSNKGEDEDDGEEKVKKKKRRKLPGPNEGHYTVDNVTYLEGITYASILEQDMPIQLWIGPLDTTTERRRSTEIASLWKMGLVVKVHGKKNDKDEEEEEEKEENITCDIAYLRSPSDQDETLEKSVPSNRIRIVLGSDPDVIPNTLEEARLMLLGGEEEIIIKETNNNASSSSAAAATNIDENTGLSSWGTVSIRRTTAQHEISQEKSRQRQKQRDEKRIQEEKERELNERKMEEAKLANNDDSALGAYDVWSASGKVGYKGVDIHGGGVESKSGMGKSGGKEEVRAGVLSKGKGMVAFKKVKKKGGGNDDGGGGGGEKKSLMFGNKKAKKKKNRRTTFADDDDD